MDFVISMLQKDKVHCYWNMKWYPEAYYILAMLDYLCRENSLPICTNYASIRNTRLKGPLFPRDFELAAKISPNLDQWMQAMKEAISEFMHLNIVERKIRNVC